jgi:cyclase
VEDDMAVGTWHRVAPGVMAIVGYVNAGYVVADDEAVVIDTMYGPADSREIAAGLAQEFPGAAVRWVVNTHHHADHTFGNQTFAAPVVAHRTVYDTVKANLAGPWSPAAVEAQRKVMPNPERWDGLDIVPPQVLLYDQLDLAVGGRLVRLAHFGGHTPGSCIAFLEEDGVIFAGDLLFIGRYPFLGHGSAGDWLAALRELLAMKPRQVVPGHGPILTGAQISREIDRLAAYMEETMVRVEALRAAGRSREEVLADAGFPKYADEGYEHHHRVNIARVWDELAGKEGAAT